MLALAFRSALRHRASTVATGIIATIGTALVVAMAALLATGLTAGERSEFLTLFPMIVGGWIVVIVVFAMASTIGVTLEGRAGEFTGLRLIGAEPGQIRRLIVAETAVVSVVAAIPGAVLGVLLGGAALAGIRGGGAADPSTPYLPGVLPPLVGAVVVVAASVVAGILTGRRPARGSVLGAPDEGTPRVRRGARRLIAVLVVLAGVGSAVATLTSGSADLLAAATTGPACVLLAVGACLFAPELIGLAGHLSLGTAASAWLAARNLDAAPERVRPLVTFLTLFVGVAAGTLGMQGIENAAGSAMPDAELIATINYLVVGLLAGFMAVALVNNLIAAVLRRRAEFSMMRLIGATPPETQRMLLREVTAATVVSVLAGGAAGLVATIPYAVVKTGALWAALAPLPYLAAAAVGTALALGVAALVGRRAVPGARSGRRAVAAPA
ncbi:MULTISPECIES: FtsX-like permease family protein [unclassified Microbacterium]|uniref:FtsX-like permease family protein n=1 Tax=unclassified Microbacterium TaxID=2609290 RepID=UPI0012F9E392|nr:FtsX-like permease family protein [Microbacterium sp. MAH-37]MVQ41570.1 FtsX-like permease family protein [Microbacterium sp. MAH-37]